MQDDIKPASKNTEGTPKADAASTSSGTVINVETSGTAPAASPAPETVISPVVSTTSDSQSSEPTSEAAPAAEASVPQADVPIPPQVGDKVWAPAHAQPGRLRKKLFVAFLLLLLIAVAAAAILYGLHKQKQPVASAHPKQDIAQINYGVVGPNLDSLYPLTTNTAWSTQVDTQIFEGLVGYQDQTHLVPLLATGWTNPDNTHWVFTVRQGVKFHNGHALTAQAVKASLDYAMAHQGDNEESLVLALASTIKSVSADGSKVTIATNGPDPTLLNRLAALYVFDATGTPGDAATGTGPYELKAGQTLAKSDTVDLVAVPNYWGGHVYTRAIHMVAISDADALAAQTAAGKFDIAGALNAKQVAAAHTPSSISVSDLGVNFIGLNTLKATSPLHDIHARQAVQYGLDVPALLKATNIDTQAKQLNQLLPPAVPGYDASLPATQHDAAKAKQLLSGVPTAKTPLTFSYPKADEAYATEIIRQLTAIGFTIQPQPVDSLGSLVGIALGGKTDMFYLGYSSDTLDGLDVLTTILVGNKDYDNPTIDSLAQQASTTLEPATRIALLQKISKQVATDIPDVPLFTQSRVFALSHTDYHMTPDLANAAAGVFFWKVYQQ